jgi:membrane-associated phospholipid phosphatase
MRPVAAIAVAVLTVGLGVLVLSVFHHVGPLSVELRWMRGRVHQDDASLVFRFGIEIGQERFVRNITLVLVAWAVVRRWWAGVLACLAIPGSVYFVERVMKPIVDRQVSVGDHHGSFPSGSTTAVAAWLTLLVVLTWPILRFRTLKILVGLVALGITAVAAAMIVVSGKHYPLDAVAGAICGCGAVLTWCLFLDLAHDAVVHFRSANGRR